MLCDPSDGIVEVVLLFRAQETELAPRLAAAAHVHMYIRVTLLYVEFDRPGFAPQELRTRGQSVVVVPIGRGGKKSWETAGGLGGIDGGPDGCPVADGDQDFLEHGFILNSNHEYVQSSPHCKTRRQAAAGIQAGM